MTDWQDRARRELRPKIASSAYVITIDPGEDIDPKVALETGYAILLGKPIVLLTAPGLVPNAGLRRIATHHIALTAPIDTDAGKQELMARLAALDLVPHV